jgi:IclR family transcriptional regulator, acetate operon repressor
MTQKETSRSALRALEVFEAMCDAGRPLSLSEAARLTDMPVSTCHGVFRALEQRGFLYFDSERNAYPTRRLWDMAQRINAYDPVVARVEPMLTKLRDEVDEAVILGVRQADSVVYLLVLESSQAIRYSSHAGEHKPLHSSSIGKVMLGALSPEELNAWMRSAELKKVTDRTIVTASRLRADIATAKERGFFVTRGENVSDVMAIAAPLKIGASLFGVAIAGPLQRLADKEAALGKKLVATLKKIEASNSV